MDKLEQYREYIKQLLTERAELRSPNDIIETQLIFDTERDHYQLVRTGWRDNNNRVYGCLLHVDIKESLLISKLMNYRLALEQQCPPNQICIAFRSICAVGWAIASA